MFQEKKIAAAIEHFTRKILNKKEEKKKHLGYLREDGRGGRELWYNGGRWDEDTEKEKIQKSGNRCR